MTTTYEMMETEQRLPDQGKYFSYGIRMVMIQEIKDLSTDRDKVRCLVRKMNRGKLLPEHFMDIVEDFLA